MLHTLAVQHYNYKSSTLHLEATGKTRPSCCSDSRLDPNIQFWPFLEQLVGIFPTDLPDLQLFITNSTWLLLLFYVIFYNVIFHIFHLFELEILLVHAYRIQATS